MQHLFNLPNRFSTTCLVLAAVACGSGAGTTDSSGAATNEDFALTLADTVNTVIIPTYADLHEKALALQACTQQLATVPSDAQLAACQSAWVSARVPWEQSESFLFGPVTDQGLDPAMDSWPVDHQQLDALLASSVELSADTITANLGGGMKGFHTIEYLLWSSDQSRTAAELAAKPRDVEYLVALTTALAADTGQLMNAWVGSATETGYGERFAAAGTAHGGYSSQVFAIQELVGAMANITDEVAFGKIAEPFKARDPNRIESQFSYNSLRDFADNIRGVQNVYLASLDQSPGKNSLSKVVSKYDPALDLRVTSQIATGIQAIEAIGANDITFRDAILDTKHSAVIENAQDELAKLMDLLNGDVMQLFAR